MIFLDSASLYCMWKSSMTKVFWATVVYAIVDSVLASRRVKLSTFGTREK
jgi:hypothetical protein